MRLAHGVTQEELVEATGISLKSIQNIERGKSENPGVRYILLIARALGTSVEDLCEDEWLRLNKWHNGRSVVSDPVDVLEAYPGFFEVPDPPAPAGS